MKHLIITIMLLSTVNLFGQVQNFNEIPKNIIEQFDKMGVDDSPLLNCHESAYFNVIFKKCRKDFDFTKKNVGFLTGSSGKTKSSKKEYFKDEKERFYRNSTLVSATLYIFDPVQKKDSGGYDAAIVYWSKFVIPTETIIKRLKEKK